MRGIPQALVPVLLGVAVAGCGSSPRRSAAAVASCLNGQDFLVTASGARIDGTSPGGVAFTLVVRRGRASTLDTSGAPGGATLSRPARAVVASCLEKHGPQPGTLTAPAAR